MSNGKKIEMSNGNSNSIFIIKHVSTVRHLIIIVVLVVHIARLGTSKTGRHPGPVPHRHVYVDSDV